MPHSFMDIGELARFLGLDLRQMERMAQRGEIPCQRVGGQYRFNRAAVTEWCQQRMGQLKDEHLASMDAGITAHREVEDGELIVSAMLRPEAVCSDLSASTKGSVLKELVALANETELVYDGETLLEALRQREELRSTALEGGIAIPHPRRPLPYVIADAILVVARTPRGIGFGGPDGRLTNLFFMTCSKDDRHHLHGLARLCRMLSDFNFVQALRMARTSEEMMELMRLREAEVLADSF